MNKKILVALAAEIKGVREAASQARLRGDFESSNNLEARAAGAEDLILAVAPDFNPNFDSNRFVEASRL